MAQIVKLFQISTPVTTVKLDSQGQATVQYTVKNVSARVIDGCAVLVSLPQNKPPDGPVEKGWVKVDGKEEKHFAVNEEQTFTVKIVVPPASPSGNYTFRLDVVNRERRDEGDQGQPVGFTVTTTPPPPPRWWIPVAAVVVLAILGAGGWWVWSLYNKIEVPNVIGRKFEEAKNLLEEAGLKVKEIQPSPNPAGLVQDQDPKGEKKAERGTEVALVVVAPQPDKPKPEDTPDKPPVGTPESICYDLVQNKIAWDYKGSKKWNLQNVQRLCRGTTNGSQPPACFNRVMHGGLNWGGGTQWQWQNAINLCEGTNNADTRITCFQNRIKAKQSWQSAIKACSK